MKKITLIVSVLSILAGGLLHPAVGGAAPAGEFPAVEVYRQRSDAVVLILARSGGKASSMVGAGSIIDSSGVIITVAHVVIDKKSSRPYSNIRVYLKPDRVTGNFSKDLRNGLTAKVTAYDRELDLAVLKVRMLPPDIGIIKLADADEISTGESVVAIGHPEMGGLWTLSFGRISGEIQNLSSIEGKHVFQTDTSVNRGNSGGPLLDRRGYLVGVNANIARIGAGNMPITGVNFAIKSSVVKRWLESKGFLIAYGTEPLYSDEQAAKTGRVETPVEKEGRAVVVKEPVKPPLPKEELQEKAIEKRAGLPEVLPGGEGGITDEPVAAPEERVLTKKRPYRIETLFQQVEREMEDMMEEMRGKIRRQ